MKLKEKNTKPLQTILECRAMRDCASTLRYTDTDQFIDVFYLFEHYYRFRYDKIDKSTHTELRENAINEVVKIMNIIKQTANYKTPTRFAALEKRSAEKLVIAVEPVEFADDKDFCLINAIIYDFSANNYYFALVEFERKQVSPRCYKVFIKR